MDESNLPTSVDRRHSILLNGFRGGFAWRTSVPGWGDDGSMIDEDDDGEVCAFGFE